MSEKMIWIERFFNLLPISKKFKVQILVRCSFLFAVWLIGLAVFALDGQALQYTSNALWILVFGSYLLILMGTFLIQNSLGGTFLSVRPLLNIDDSKFKKLIGRVEWYTYSVVPYLLLTLILFARPLLGYLTIVSITLIEVASGIWIICFGFFSSLLSATGIWICVSIWLTTYLISRQPIKLELSPETINKFRGLTVLGLQFAAIYFLAVSFGFIFPLSQPIHSLTDVIMSPILPFTAVGLVGVLLPFYNIHRTLLSLKKKELSRIQSEFEHLETTLEGILTKTDDQLSDSACGQSTGARARHIVSLEGSLETLITAGAVTLRIFNLQVRERRIRAVQEWPIDIGFISKLLGLGLTPVAAKIIQEILSRFSS